MTLEWLARAAIVLYVVYSTASYAEGLRTRGSVGLRSLGVVFESAALAALIWAAW